MTRHIFLTFHHDDRATTETVYWTWANVANPFVLCQSTEIEIERGSSLPSWICRVAPIVSGVDALF